MINQLRKPQWDSSLYIATVTVSLGHFALLDRESGKLHFWLLSCDLTNGQTGKLLLANYTHFMLLLVLRVFYYRVHVKHKEIKQLARIVHGAMGEQRHRGEH